MSMSLGLMELSHMVYHHRQHHQQQRLLPVNLSLNRYLPFFHLAVGQANTEWFLNPVTREVKDQVGLTMNEIP